MPAVHVYYPAVLERAAEGYGVWFPDFPGCVSAGGNVQRAAAAAAEALQLHAEGMRADGQALPEPSDPGRLRPGRGDSVVFVPLVAPGRIERINLTLDRGVLALADLRAAARGLSRSALIAGLIRRDAATGRISPAVGKRMKQRARR